MRNHILAFLMMLGMGAPVLACGADTDCAIGDRSYRIAMPEGHDGAGKVPVLAFAHGYKGSAKGVMRNKSLRRLASDLGAALIAFNSIDGTWSIPNHPGHMEADGSVEFSYVRAVLEDAASQFPLDTSRVVSTGFSSGGMLTWNLACEMPDRFAGFVPVAGTFWLVPPETCNKPVTSIVHIHGDADRTVPLTGRVIGPTKQGEVAEALAMYQEFGGFAPKAKAQAYGPLTCDSATNNDGDVMMFCLFKGGHSFRTEYVRFGWEQLMAAGRL